MFLCPVLLLLFSLFLLFAAVQCFYALFFFRRVFALPANHLLPPAERQPVTILICAKNEAANLQKHLPSILAQRYCNESGKALFEVLVVNDGSKDDTEAILKALKLKYENLRHVGTSNLKERRFKGKKHALSVGLESAKYEWLLLTDADCEPASADWLAYMVSPLATGKKIVAGYSGYRRGTGILNAITRWETLHAFMQYSTYILAGKPYMAVGRNMACTREIATAAQRSPVWNALPSGDDDLMVSICGTAGNVALVADGASFTHTEPKATWREWIKQKQRHLSTGKYYKTSSKILLGAYGISHAGMWLSFFALLFLGYQKEAIIVMGFRCVAYWGCWYFTAKRLHEKIQPIFFPFFDIGWMVYNFAFLPYITWKNKELWK
jgi:cellulose synthase/poly-beta-1,6-N-acetylglucosamine synthase-like glycosyltransferase